jgi:hypothetical protein
MCDMHVKGSKSQMAGENNESSEGNMMMRRAVIINMIERKFMPV